VTNDWLEDFSKEVLDNLSTHTDIQFPMYVPSKGRSDLKLTTKALADVDIPF
jgi:uncharacterized protein YdaT